MSKSFDISPQLVPVSLNGDNFGCSLWKWESSQDHSKGAMLSEVKQNPRVSCSNILYVFFNSCLNRIINDTMPFVSFGWVFIIFLHLQIELLISKLIYFSRNSDIVLYQ